MFLIIIIILDHYLLYYDADGMKESLRTQLNEWHKYHENDGFDFVKEIHDYFKADVQLHKSGCIKFRNNFIKDTDIDPFHCLHERFAYLLPETKIYWTRSGQRLSLT